MRDSIGLARCRPIDVGCAASIRSIDGSNRGINHRALKPAPQQRAQHGVAVLEASARCIFVRSINANLQRFADTDPNHV
jgi:hypothetical protein